MKLIPFAFVLSVISFVSYGEVTSKQHNHHHHNADHAMTHDAATKNMVATSRNKSTTQIIGGYLALKEALVKSDSKKAAELAESLLGFIGQFKSLSSEEKDPKTLSEIIANAREQAEHIAKNASNIDHQREHLEILSKAFKSLIDLVGSDRVLYQQYCPMALNGKGAHWLSSSDKIQNPYFGDAMLQCGVVKQKIGTK